jgi:sRNA-binding carbon storage regulator CsrA
MLVLTIHPDDNYIEIGKDIVIYFEAAKGGRLLQKIKVKIDAPKEIRIERRKVIERNRGGSLIE